MTIRHRLKYLGILYKLYYASIATGPDEVSLQLPELAHIQSNNNIDAIFAESSSILPTIPNTSMPASETQNTIPAPAHLALRKRKRGREGTQAEETTNRSETLECVKALTRARLEAAEIIASATKKNDVPEALTILLRDFTKEPRKLSSDDMQIAIDFLSAPDKASIFLALSRQHGMEEHRDRWLERQAEVNIAVIGFDSDPY